MNTNVNKELAGLDRMTTGQLLERYAELYGQPARTRHKAYLVRKVAWRIQANAEGDLSERARRRAAELADDADIRVMPPRPRPSSPLPKADEHVATVPISTDGRLPSPGTVITRIYKDRTLQVIVLANGFEFEGERYKTLTAVARRYFDNTITSVGAWLKACRQPPPWGTSLMRSSNHGGLGAVVGSFLGGVRSQKTGGCAG